MATATQRRGWSIDSVMEKEQTDRDKARSIRARQRALGREIRRMFDGVVKEPVPDDFMDLLKRIDDSDDGKDGTPAS